MSSVRPSTLFKQIKFQAKTMFATGETVGLAEWIIISFMQYHLTDKERNPDAELDSHAPMDTEQQRMKVLEKYKNGILREARENIVFRERVIELVKECRKLGIF